MRRRSPSTIALIGAGLVIGVLGVVLVVRALMSSSDSTSDNNADRDAATTTESTTASTSPPATSPTTTPPTFDLDQAREGIARGFHEDFAPLIDEAQADCLAQAVVDVLGADRLSQLSESPSDAVNGGGLGQLTPEEDQALDQQMRPCVPDEIAIRLDL